MSDYDRMSMDDLLHELFYILDWGRDRTAIMAALRRKIIKEATVGEVKVVTTEHFDEIARPEDTERIVTMSEQIISKAWVPEGEYLLVKKEG